MNKLLQTTLITAVLSTGAMATMETMIEGNISIENTLNINKEAYVEGTLDFTLGGHGYIADDVAVTNYGTIKLGQPEDATDDDLATVNVTREISTVASIDAEEATTTYYQYRYISTDGAVKYVWSSNENATSSDTDFVADMTNLSATSALSDYDSGFGLVKAIAGERLQEGR